MSRSSALPVILLALFASVAAEPATAEVGIEVQSTPSRPGEEGVPGAQCAMFILFTASDGCSTCFCSGGDARMTACDRSACPEQGNYTMSECVENELYVGNDGCNSCQCNEFRRFSSCTRKICLLSDASSTPT